MSGFFRALLVVCACWLLLVPTQPAVAQEVDTMPVPRYELSAGYAFLRNFSDYELPVTNLRKGWYFSAAFNSHEWWGVVGEFGAHFKHYEMRAVVGPTDFREVSLYTLMGGPRVFQKMRRFVPHAQVLVGTAHIRERSTQGLWSGEFSDTNFAIQPGVGVTLYLSDHLGFRAAVDLRSILHPDDGENESDNELRVAGGFAVQWGGR